MCFLCRFIKSRKEARKEADELSLAFGRQIDEALVEFGSLFKDIGQYIDPEVTQSLKTRWTSLSERLNSYPWKTLRKSQYFQMTRTKAEQFQRAFKDIERTRESHNYRFVREHIQDVRARLCPVEGKQLDDQQLGCIMMPSHNHVVVAGAGTGKTTTVVGKIKWLLLEGICKPEEILVLSFTNASAAEMSQRIRTETGKPIDAMTFHKLGMEIITAVDRAKPRVVEIQLRMLIHEKIQERIQDPAYLKDLNTFFTIDPSKARSEYDFRNLQEYEAYLQANPPTTLCGETVKSYSEMNIANFLYRNRIPYEYEAPYQINTATEESGQYLPDFHLQGHDIYIEHFALDQNGAVPPYFKSSSGLTPTQTYTKDMEWKRGIHQKYGTRLIELTYADSQQGILFDRLCKQLESFGIQLNPMTDAELWQEISTSDNGLLDGFIELMETVINLIRSKDTTIDALRAMNEQRLDDHRWHNDLVLRLVSPLLDEYIQQLTKSGCIDFNDMIHRATRYVMDGSWKHSYRQVIVDEYQDMANGRYSLLHRMRIQSDYSLFCVGDDWQSIYRFAGSDINYVYEFDRYWGPSEKSRIETTYRFPRQLIDISSTFIMQNPRQIRKQLRSPYELPIFPLGFIEGYTIRNAVSFMADRMRDLERNSSVLLIGRYRTDVRILDGSLFKYRYDNSKGSIQVTLSTRTDLDISFITAHKSKGLQADYVFVLNNTRGRMGFPSAIQDDSVLDLLLECKDDYPDAEERRLFYVAITRTKKRVWLITCKNKDSNFAIELRRRYASEIQKEPYTCPMCGGKLVRKKGKFGEFYGCTKFNQNGCRYTRSIR